MPPGRYLRILVLAALVGVPAAAAAVIFTSLLHGMESLVWHELPDAAGWDEPPWWFVLAVPTLGGAVVAAALRLPGHGGHSAMDGLSLGEVPLRHLPSILLAALASLSFGLVLGPEAPLVALGLALGLVARRFAKEGATDGQILALAGGYAAISTVLGGPLTSALLLFEVLAAGGAFPSAQLGRLLVPGLVASGVGALVFTGVEDWPGVREFVLELPELPAYPTVELVDIAWCLPVAAAVAVVVVACQVGAGHVARKAQPRGAATLLVGGGLLVGLLAVVFRELSDRPVDLVLFSGANSLGPTVAEGSAGVLVALILAKGLAYAVSLGAGFRGGPVFPAVALGVALGVLAENVLPGLALTPAVIAGVAAGAAAALRAPFFGALLATLLVGAAAADTIPIAILAAVTGWLVASALQPPEAEPPAAEPA
jgi:H+/Cl- antiporter ClcA